MFEIFKPKAGLKPTDVYQTKLQLAQSIIAELVAMGFNIELVLADSLYGDHPFVGLLDRLNLPWIVAIRSNHGQDLRKGHLNRGMLELRLASNLIASHA